MKAALLALALSATLLHAKAPNVIVIMVDDFGYECITANGGQSYQTPNVDKLAAEGVRFENYHAQPLCTPTRVQLMTGKFNVRNYLNFGTLPRSETTFGHLMKKAGYATGICGKWQLGAEPDAPQHFGFDEALLWQHTRRPPRYANPGLELNATEKDYRNGEYGPTLVNDFALDFITRHQAEKFFLYYPMILTHDPFQPTPDSPDWDPKTTGEKAKQHVKHFAEMTAYMDKLIGQLMAKLEDLQLKDNTLVLFFGDNGTSSKITSKFQGVDYPGGKGSTKANGTHVPMIAHWPAGMKKGQVCPDLLSCADILPTICEAAGVAQPEGIDGRSFLPQIQGQPGNPRDSLYVWYSPRQRPDLTVKEYAFDHHYKLYRSGEFYALPNERDPLPSSGLPASAQAAKVKLQATLDQFTHARPAALDQQFTATTPKKAKRAKK